MTTFNIYCDESCHLEHDGKPVMVLGALWCPADRSRDVAVALREIKIRHGLPQDFEIKWGKVSPAKVVFYADVLTFFFDQDALRYRCIIALKRGLQHGAFEQDHDTWYFKMYYLLLRRLLLDRDNQYRVYLDVKDTRSAAKIKKLHDVLCNQMHDFDQQVLQRVQAVHSSEIEQIQLADLISGAISFAARNLAESGAKCQLVDLIKTRIHHSLSDSTWFSERKFNIFRWEPQVPKI
jgi:Protein of unknown function (DUF3800)